MIKSENDIKLLGTIVAASLSRSVINTAKRFVYPFAPVISRGLGVPLTAITSAIAVNQATSLVGPFTSHLADKTGYRRMMIIGLLLLAAGMLAAGAFPVYYTLVAAMFCCGLGKTLFDPAIQAYVSQRVPYKRRGLVIGIMEISWAAATLAGIPIVGLLIDAFGWRSPFFALAGACVICLVLVLIYIRDDGGLRSAQPEKRLLASLAELLKNRRALGAAGFGFFISFANDNLFVIYGAWLESSFHLSVVALGMGTIVIGVAEFSGELLTAALSDRIGLKRSVMAGVGLCCLAYLVIPWAGNSLAMALSSLFVLFFLFEFAIVSFLSMCTELVAGSRATMMSLFFAAGGLGRVAGAFAGGFIWKELGMGTVCMTSALLNGVALFILMWGLARWSPGH